MSEQPWLVTTCVFKGNQYLVKMNTNRDSTLELSVVDKHTGEEWSSQYDGKFIENLTLKTGNYKRFDIFVRMLKSGLLRTSECVSLDLLTFDALELLRGKKQDKNGCKIDTPPSSRSSRIITSANRRYLILTYTVEFDRIHYPLPMEYIGPPNPQILQATIRRLEAEVLKLRSKLTDKKENSSVEHWKDRVKKLEAENQILEEEVALLRQLLKQSGVNASSISPENIPQALQSLEEQVKRERATFRATLLGLQEQNHRLRRELDEVHYVQKDSQKPEPVNILWKHRGRSPATYHMNEPPGPNEKVVHKSPLTSRNEVWRTRLNNPNFEAVRPNLAASDKRNRVDSNSKHSESDIRSRSKSPNVVKLNPQSGNRSHVYAKARTNQHEVSSCGRSSSSDCSSERGRMKSRKPKSNHSRSSSQGSSCSASSSITSSSFAKRDRASRRNAQEDAGFMNPARISNLAAQRPKPLNRQPPHRKGPRKSSRRGTTGRMSDLETRIKALQNMLKEGLSLP